MVVLAVAEAGWAELVLCFRGPVPRAVPVAVVPKLLMLSPAAHGPLVPSV